MGGYYCLFCIHDRMVHVFPHIRKAKAKETGKGTAQKRK